MKTVHKYSDFPVGINTSELMRLLAYKSAAEPEGQLKSLISEVVQEAERLARPRAVFALFGKTDLPPESFLGSLFDAETHERTGERKSPRKPIFEVALSICTIGNPLEDAVAEHSGSGEMTRALILDAAGSVLAEAACDYANGKICAIAAERSLYTAPRISPGYGKWRIEEQEMIFGLLPASSIGVSLTKSFMMVPRKSVSFAVTLLAERPTEARLSRCAVCGRQDCEYRQ